MTHLSRRKPQKETGHDKAVDLAAPPGIGVEDLERNILSCPGDGKEHISQLREKVAEIAAVLPIGSSFHPPCQVLRDRFLHPVLQETGNRVPSHCPVLIRP